MEQNRINFYNEKKWIMAWWFKRNRKRFSKEGMFSQWGKWWKNDFRDMDGVFTEAFEWVQETINTKSLPEIQAERKKSADNKSREQGKIQKLAYKRGYYVKKCSTSNYPMKVSGYAVFKSKKSKKPLYGENFDLTIGQVRQFLEGANTYE